MFQRQKDARQKEFAKRRENLAPMTSQNHPPAAAAPVEYRADSDEDLAVQQALEEHYENRKRRDRERDDEMAAVMDGLAIAPANGRLTRAVASSRLDEDELADQLSEALISSSASSDNRSNSEELIITAPAAGHRISRSTFQLMPPPAAAEQGRQKKSRREKPEEITHEPSPPSSPRPPGRN